MHRTGSWILLWHENKLNRFWDLYVSLYSCDVRFSSPISNVFPLYRNNAFFKLCRLKLCNYYLLLFLTESFLFIIKTVIVKFCISVEYQSYFLLMTDSTQEQGSALSIFFYSQNLLYRNEIPLDRTHQGYTYQWIIWTASTALDQLSTVSALAPFILEVDCSSKQISQKHLCQLRVYP